MKRYRNIRVKEDSPIDLGEKVQSLMGSHRAQMSAEDAEEQVPEGELLEEANE